MAVYKEYRPRLHLHIGDLTDDMSAMVKMTGFNVSHLRRLYHNFLLREFVQAHIETVLQIGTGHWSNGLEKFYRIHPEELFLFSLTKCKTGMTNEEIVDMFFGGDYNLELRVLLVYALSRSPLSQHCWPCRFVAILTSVWLLQGQD